MCQKVSPIKFSYQKIFVLKSRTVWRNLKEHSVLRVPHVQRTFGDAAVGEELLREREPLNAQDQYAVAVKREGIIIGHLPRKISRLCLLFLRQGGVLLCTVTGGIRYTQKIYLNVPLRFLVATLVYIQP